mgnify:CR=1 FL=1
MKKPFVPTEFVVPLRVEQAGYTLSPLTTAHVDKDYEAVMSSRESLRHIFCEYDTTWPKGSMTLTDNYRDLARHQQEFDERQAFAYTMETPDGQSCIGCVYIYPCQRGNYDAQVYYWVIDRVKPDGLEADLDEFLHRWLKETWPFELPVFPGRGISWQEWEGLNHGI